MYNDFVTNEVLRVEVLTDNRSAFKERQSDEEDEVALPPITMSRTCDVFDALKPIRTFCFCSPEEDDTTFKQVNTLENFVLNQSLRCLIQKSRGDYLQLRLSKENI